VVTACVVLKPNQKAEPREIIEFCDGRIASYKKPKRVFFVESLPKSPAGKIQKSKLREQFKNSR
jgi:acyl-CoA synthetase (AMP-forming)/AMP-acid ligase II